MASSWYKMAQTCALFHVRSLLNFLRCFLFMLSWSVVRRWKYVSSFAIHATVCKLRSAPGILTSAVWNLKRKEKSDQWHVMSVHFTYWHCGSGAAASVSSSRYCVAWGWQINNEKFTPLMLSRDSFVTIWIGFVISISTYLLALVLCF